MKTTYNTELLKTGRDIIKKCPQVIEEFYSSKVERFYNAGSKSLMKDGKSCVLEDGTSLNIKTCVFRDEYDAIPLTVERMSADGYWRNALDGKDFGYFLYIIKCSDHEANFYSISRSDAMDLARQFPIIERECGGRMQRLALIPFNHYKVRKSTVVYDNNTKKAVA